MPSFDTSSLCAECGLCCDGTLFAHVPLSEEEAERLLARDVALGLRNGRQVLPQRCSALEGTCCRVYADRPSTCRSYECLLLRATKEGEVGLNEALAVVKRAQQLTDALHSAPKAQSPLSAVSRDHLPDEFSELDAYLRKHFLGRSA